MYDIAIRILQPKSRWLAAAAVACTLLLTADPAPAIEFDFEEEPGIPQEAVDGFVRAGELWQALLDDDITVRVIIGFRQLSPGVLGSTSSQRTTASYGDLVTALGAQSASADDGSSVAALQAAPAFRLLMNRTSDSPNGSGNAQTFLDEDGGVNNSTVRLTRANAKALGLLDADAEASDASIIFSDEFNWDFEPDDGITPNHFNFVFVAAHEIGHMLGFTSGVDIVDINSPPQGGPFPGNAFTFVSPADIFRFSTASLADGPGVFDWCADNRPKNFSVDGGAALLGEFSRGRNFGDGQQASHWRDNQGLGLMDPTVAPGEVSQITELDQRFFDVIGYERAGAPPTLTTEADLALVASSDREISYTLVVSNAGPDPVTGATVSDQPPASLTGVQWACASTGGGSCTASGTGAINDIVDLPVGATLTYTLTGTAGGLVNQASVAPPAGVTDPDPDNNAG